MTLEALELKEGVLGCPVSHLQEDVRNIEGFSTCILVYVLLNCVLVALVCGLVGTKVLFWSKFHILPSTVEILGRITFQYLTGPTTVFLLSWGWSYIIHSFQ